MQKEKNPVKFNIIINVMQCNVMYNITSTYLTAVELQLLHRHTRRHLSNYSLCGRHVQTISGKLTALGGLVHDIKFLFTLACL